MNRPSYLKTSLWFCGVALLCLFLADLEISAMNPWRELGRMALGALTPDFRDGRLLAEAMMNTVAFAFLGVAVGSAAGLGMALIFRYRFVRVLCAALRSVHELFWALIFLQFVGLNVLTGLLAIAVPFSGIFAKVYSEILEEADTTPLKAVPVNSGHASVFLFVRLPGVWPHLVSYTSYRLECGLRSSAILGFVGLPTMGFHLETFFRQGLYSGVSSLMILFFVLIATLRWWVRPRLLWVYLLGSAVFLWGNVDISGANLVRFLTEDIVPYPLRTAAVINGTALTEFGEWSWQLLVVKGLPAAIATLVLTQIALTGTAVFALAFFPLVSEKFFGRVGRTLGHIFLVVTRSTPEYILTFIFVHLWGPSMLPAIVALALHNGAIIGHLIGRHADQVPSRPDSSRGLNLYGYEVLPRVYGQFLAFLFYRWEVILRETAILGMLGIHTLGFYVDSAFQDIRLDRAMVLIVFTALLNIGVDAFSRNLRARLRLSTTAKIE